MKNYHGRKISRNVRTIYRSIVSIDRKKAESDNTNHREVARNTHLIRSCCLNILNVQQEFSECSCSENGLPMILEESKDFCEISDYSLTEESVSLFCRKLARRQTLSYAEIACLIPAMEYYCLRRLGSCLNDAKNTVQAPLRSLYVLNSFDCSMLAETLSKTEDVLRKDDIYPHLDLASKNLYRTKVRRLAKKIRKPERETAVELLKEARKATDGAKKQIGAFLCPERKNRFYFPALFCFSVLILSGAAIVLRNFVLIFLSVIPALISAKLLCDTVFSRIVKPELMPKIKITKDNCPATLVTIVSMVSNSSEANKLLHRLDVLAHRIPIPAIRIGLLLDLPASDVILSDDDRELLSHLEQEINKRNQQHNRFFCAVRNRAWDAVHYHYEAFGRKQGAMMEFSDLVNGENQKFSLAVGNLQNAEYLVTLDADTEPAPGAIESMIGFMEHPNHIPTVVTDPNGFSYVKSGYGAAAPRVEANPESSFRTPYSAMMSGNTGTEFYKNPHFNLYQDLFSEGIFCGKGILRIPLYKKLIAERFREDPILSHDLPEGEILRCANLSDLVFFDEIPDSVISDEKRTHRWIRGDFQNASFLSFRNNKSNLFRFKIVHNLLRALFPVACFLLISCSVIYPKGLIASLFWMIFPLLLRIPWMCSALFGKVRRFHPLREFMDAVFETVLNILLLPTRAKNNLDAALRGTVRLFSGKKKLEWTTAASAAKNGGEIRDYFYQLRWQQVGFLFLFSPQTILIGALWMIGPVVARHSSLPYRKDIAQSEELRSDLEAMWQYYADLMNEKSHWLPPDNYQQEPLNIVAQRTSPTNIGLATLSILGAFDLHLIGENELYTRIENTLNTVESLPKWKGHLYNWYDTQTLKVLPPKFISTVDCGNWAVSFYTLAKGLSELNTDPAKNLVKRIRTLLDAADFSVLYDSKKKLFPIGYNGEEEQMSSSYYDLYASEARLTSYYAIMQHQIPLNHWTQLARPTSNEHGSLILSSWSGTMFEYFMPHLFLPAYRRTLSGESLRGVVRSQIRYSDKRIPWGISESCYYAFDSLLNYQYRAFGIPSAALRRDLSFPMVISPYSTFLVAPWFPSVAEKNKKRLPKGKYGYYEAVDYRSGVDNPRVVQCFMAHHIGMSFLSGVNVLTDKIMQKRFMAGEGEAYTSLLTERIPAYSKNYFPNHIRDREHWQPAEIRIDRPDPEHPKVCLLSNGKLTEVLSDSGAGLLRTKETDLTKYSADPYAPTGLFLFVRSKGTLYSTTYAPLYQDKNYRMFFDGSGATCYGSFLEFETRMSVTMLPDLPVSVRELAVKNNQMTENSYEFFLFAEPVICDRRKYEAHPEYNDLFLTADYDPSIRVLSFCRKTDGEELWFSVTASEQFRFDVKRDQFRELSDLGTCKTDGASRYPVFPALILHGNLNIRGRGTGTVRFFFSVGKTKEESSDLLRRAVSQNFETLQRRYRQAFDALCFGASIRSADRLIFDQIISKILFPVGKSASEAKLSNTLSLRSLWKYGISGDIPILSVRIGKDSIARILPFIKSLFLLLYAGIPVDLVLLYREEEGYQTPMKTALDSLLSEIDESVRPRIFALNIRTMDDYLLIQKCSSLFINLERGWKLRNPSRSFRPIRTEGIPEPFDKLKLPLGRGGYGKNASYMIPKSGQEPLRPWSLILANPRFGTVLTERSLGYTFAENASENRITPRTSGSGYYVSGERYYGVIRGKRYDLLKNASVEFRPDRAIYRIELIGVKIKTEVFIPPYLAAKIIEVTVESDSETLPEIVYEPKIILGKENRQTATRVTEDDKIFFNNACNDSYGAGYAVLFGINVIPEGELLRFRPDKEKKQGVFILAYGSGLRSAHRLANLLSEPQRISKESAKASVSAKNYLKIETQDKEFDAFCNGFLQQQIKNSRIYGRTGPSQPGGAYGFRDQLQDSVCLAMFDSSYLKRQILRCASHQFEEGDVLHWWHPRRNHRDDGIRTRFSDDPFWFVYACTEYFRMTEDPSFFRKSVRYLHAPPLKDSESDRYFTPEFSELREPLYQHAMRAIRFGMKTGKHGLILFGSGDWNDGMNGVEPGGETVWGSMFALLCIDRYLPLAEIFGTDADVSFLKDCSEALRGALQDHAFAQGRYLRGYRADGTPFGNSESIDLIPQAFAVFCGLDPEKNKLATTKAYDTLWDKDRKLIRLLTPAYQPQNDGFPGSIANYPPGIRENGGQYTHAGIWFAKAMFRSGNPEAGWEILSGVNPVTHTETPAAVRQYGAEPYVLAADVYTLPERNGLGGWTHYTGAAGWYLKTVTEDLLGIRRQGRAVLIQPSLPSSWNGYRAELRIQSDILRIRVERGTELGIYEEGKKISEVSLQGTVHEITVIV